MGTQQTDEIAKRLVAFTVLILHLARKQESDKTLAPVLHQLIRSSGSIGANVSEASGALSKNGFARYFRIALQSANETRYWLQVLREFGSADDNLLRALESELSEFIRILRASLRTMKSGEKE